jgi:hypothetical protein
VRRLEEAKQQTLERLKERRNRMYSTIGEINQALYFTDTSEFANGEYKRLQEFAYKIKSELDNKIFLITLEFE